MVFDHCVSRWGGRGVNDMPVDIIMIMITTAAIIVPRQLRLERPETT